MKRASRVMTMKKIGVVLLGILLTLFIVPMPSTATMAGGNAGYSTGFQRPMSMMSPFGRRGYGRRPYGSRRRHYNQQRRPSHPSTTAMYDYSQHFLDDKNWITDKKIRIWDPQYNARKRANQRSWSGRLTLANIVCYAIQSFNPRFTQWGVKLSERILAGKDLYRLITPVFLHGGLYHLFTNSYSLNNVGPITEQVFGPGRFLATYLVSGATGNLLSAINSPNPALGASGAVFGVMGGLYVFLSRNDWVMGQQGEAYSSAITQTLLINLFMGAVNPMVDNWGHIGGAIGGAAMSWYFGPRLYLAELPISEVETRRVIVDKPIVRLPSSIENIPKKIGKGVGRATRRIKIWGYVENLPDKPWRRNRRTGHQGKPIDYRRRQQTAPNRSIKPKLPE
eukprot:CAMPEP_0116087994 /NCGR_PEP_ID=MMETSP0327-20121206/5644_1 /TAXON_ID=44447 /ORGANISM="Pseudo-nitzschia delicatissima, Strain B596" /LENGTH=393 /DNA_ID=CAMNT_0003579067 /DNA_START=146 /DNA_END=1327 /DNA_ORIENTATION=-